MLQIKNTLGGGDLKILNGVMKEFYALGQDIEANNFANYINGIAYIGDGVDQQNANNSNIKARALSANKMIVSYTSGTNSYLYFVVITLDNGTMSIGTPVGGYGYLAHYFSDIIIINENKAVVFTGDSEYSNRLTWLILDISGSTITITKSATSNYNCYLSSNGFMLPNGNILFSFVNSNNTPVVAIASINETSLTIVNALTLSNNVGWKHFFPYHLVKIDDTAFCVLGGTYYSNYYTPFHTITFTVDSNNNITEGAYNDINVGFGFSQGLYGYMIPTSRIAHVSDNDYMLFCLPYNHSFDSNIRVVPLTITSDGVSMHTVTSVPYCGAYGFDSYISEGSVHLLCFEYNSSGSDLKNYNLAIKFNSDYSLAIEPYNLYALNKRYFGGTNYLQVCKMSECKEAYFVDDPTTSDYRKPSCLIKAVGVDIATDATNCITVSKVTSSKKGKVSVLQTLGGN